MRTPIINTDNADYFLNLHFMLLTADTELLLFMELCCVAMARFLRGSVNTVTKRQKFGDFIWNFDCLFFSLKFGGIFYIPINF